MNFDVKFIESIFTKVILISLKPFRYKLSVENLMDG